MDGCWKEGKRIQTLPIISVSAAIFHLHLWLKRKQMKPKMSFVKGFVKRLGISKRLTFVYILLGIQIIKMRKALKDH